MEIIVIAMTVAFVLRDPAATLRSAAAYQRASAEKAQAKGRNPKRASRRGLRRYMATVWDSKWEEAARRYPEKMRNAQQRRHVRKERRKAKWAETTDRAGQRWDERFPEAGQAHRDKQARRERAERGEVPDGVVDLDAERRRREGAGAPGGPDHDPDPNTSPTPEDPVNLSDAASLRAHLSALEGYSDYWHKCAAAKERLAAGMRDAQLGEGPVGAVDSSREATNNAAERAQSARQALEDANLPVAEARASSPDAAHGDYYKKR